MENKHVKTTEVCPQQIICPIGERECTELIPVVEDGCLVLCNVQQLVERACTVRHNACVCFDREVLEIISCNVCVLDSRISTEQLEDCISIANAAVTVQVLVEARVRQGDRECIDVEKTIATVEIPRLFEGCELQHVLLRSVEAICETGTPELGTCGRIPVTVCVRVVGEACVLRRRVRVACCPACPPMSAAHHKGLVY